MAEQTTESPKTKGPRPPFPPQHQQAPGSEARMRPAPDFGEKSYRGHGRLEGRVALITGADSGIGRAVALAFAREGADLVISYLDEHDDARATKRLVEAEGHRVLLLPGDLADEEHCHGLIDETVRRFGRLDVLVNNAAHQGEAVKALTELTPERLERTFRVNVLAMFHLVRHALPHLKAGASIINTASIQAYAPKGAILDYAATKGAIVTFTKGLAESLSPQGIRANCVAPGPVWTPLVVSSFGEEKTAHFGEDSPFGRPAQPAELAPAFVFLACDESSYVSGEVLGVTGGKPLA
jgi:NAD(P)-dependent dehydrogenase (short-subunit alcohol dehydrogenase family)